MKAWFWSYSGNLFVGVAGATYPKSRQVEICYSMTPDAACSVFMRQIHPWAKQLIPPGKIPILYFKTIQPVP